MELISQVFAGIWESSGLVGLEWQNLVMLGVAGIFLVLAIFKKFEPLLLVPIAFGMILANLPGANIMLDTTGGQLGDLSGALAVEGAHWFDSGVLRILT